jgi:capsular polysaccharide biosynthesis protein
VQLRDYLRILRKRGWVIILVAVIATTSAFVFSQFQTPEYRSSIFLNVWPARLDWGLQQTIKGLLRNYGLVIKSRETAAKVIDRLQLDITPTELQGKLTVSPIESDFLIQIDANDYDPLIARDIAQKTAEVFVERIKAYMLEQDKRDRVEISIRDYAEPGILYRPKTKINMLAGGIFGVLVGGLVVFVLEWLEADVIRTSDDLERHAGVAVLGVVPLFGHAARTNRRPRQAVGHVQDLATGGTTHGR